MEETESNDPLRTRIPAKRCLALAYTPVVTISWGHSFALPIALTIRKFFLILN